MTHNPPMTKEEFITYLRETLIPDRRESGRDMTAVDFEAAILFMEGATEVEIGDEAVKIN